MLTSRSRWIEFRASRIFVRENLEMTGKLPVVFAHGLGSASSIYDPAFSRPVLDGRTLVFDFPGCGKSGKPDSYSYRMEDQAEALLAVFDQCGIDRAAVVAHSMGGSISILFAAAHPERVERLAAAEANLIPSAAKISRRIVEYGSEERFSAAFDSFVGHYHKPHSPAAMRFYATLVQTTPIALYRSAASLVSRADAGLYDTFLSLPMPKAFIRGTDSFQSLSREARSDFAARGIPVYEIAGAGHPMMEDSPDDFYAAVEQFLDR